MHHALRQSLQELQQQIPTCLKERPQWVAWKLVLRAGKETKVPLQPRNGELADCSDAHTWGTWDEALAAVDRWSEVLGVGFVFTADDPYCGVDLDDCLDLETGAIKPWALQVVQQLESYTEVSPSGQGLKIIVRARKPGTRCRTRVADGEIEIYDLRRFFTITAQRLGDTPPHVVDRQEQLTALYQRLFGAVEEPLAAQLVTTTTTEPTSLSDDEILQLACGARRSGAKFRALWEGQWQEYFNSPSEADGSVLFTLAYYTKDAAQLDRLFRQSQLMRPKWDERHGEQTYGQLTIAKALSKVKKQYRGGQRKVQDLSDGALLTPEDALLLPGTIDAHSGRLILSVERTLPTAERFVAEQFTHPDGRTLHHFLGLSLAWQQGRYIEMPENELRHRLLPWLHAALRVYYDRKIHAYRLIDFPANPQTVNAALSSVQALTHLPATLSYPCWLTPPDAAYEARDIFACPSTLLHLPTMTFLPASPNYFTTNAIEFEPDLDAAPPEHWFEFLRELLEDDVQSWELLQEWFGYCLTADTSQQKMLLIVGPRRSGKGTLARVLAQLIGAGNVCGPTTSSLAGPFGLQPLIGKSLAIVSDARFSGENIQTVVERLLCISGEDALTIDRKHLPSITTKLPTRFLFLTNELPRLSDASGALAGRFLALQLTRSFYGRENPTLTPTLLGELPGILNWALEGWRRLRERGAFTRPVGVNDTLLEMEELSSPVGAFVRDCCHVGPSYRVAVSTLYEAWRRWCEQEGRSNITTRQTFGRDLMAAVPEVVCRRNHEVGRFYEGIQLTVRAHDQHC